MTGVQTCALPICPLDAGHPILAGGAVGRLIIGAQLVPQRLARELDRDGTMLERGVGEELDDRALELADVGAHVVPDDVLHFIGDRLLEVVLFRLAAEDRDPVLEVGLADIGDHPPGEAAREARLELGISEGGRSELRTICRPAS